MRLVVPTGEVRLPAHNLAPRLTTLSGKTIGVLDNAKPNAHVLLGAIADRLVAECGAVRVVGFRKSIAGVPAPEEALRRFAAECDAVICGSGD
jgi:hypothetical protein